MTASPPCESLALPGGLSIAYRRTAGRSPGLIFLGGFRSDMTGSKAMHLEGFARERGLAYLRFDYHGHGASGGAFEEGTIGHWGNDALAVLDLLSEGPQILVGSSMGGWLALLVALTRPERVAALVGIAAAPDFTEDLIWDELTRPQREELLAEGRLVLPSDYSEEPTVVTRRLIEEGRSHLLLRSPVRVRCPVRLLHGTADPDVPCERSIQLLEALESEDATLTLVKNGDHRLSDPASLALLDGTLDGLLRQLGA